MISFSIIIHSLGAGIVAGIIYSLFFLLHHKKRIISYSHSTWAVLSLIRITLFGVFFFYMLRSTLINPILLLISFFVTHWLLLSWGF